MIRTWAKTWLLLVWVVVFSLSACGGGKTLQVGIDKGFAPFSYVEQGKVRGFEIDLWKEIARREGFAYEFKPLSQGEILQSLQNGKLDVGLGGITINKERRQLVEFTTPYYYTGLVMLVPENDRDTVNAQDLNGKVVATEIGTTAYRYASKVRGVKEIRAFPDIKQAYSQLMAGKVDAVIFDRANVRHFAQSPGKSKVRMIDNRLTIEQYGIAVNKDSGFSGRIDTALREMGRDGTFAKIYRKWFGENPPSVPGVKK
jgi:glutamine transport system substrate-binding protein